MVPSPLQRPPSFRTLIFKRSDRGLCPQCNSRQKFPLEDLFYCDLEVDFYILVQKNTFKQFGLEKETCSVRPYRMEAATAGGLRPLRAPRPAQ